MRNFIILLTFLCLPFPAFSGGPRFDEAVQLWLSGDDQNSLPILAELAGSGDADARVLLARIETSDKGPSPWRLGLSLQETRELFRWTPGYGGLARGWLSVEAKAGNPLAQAFLTSRLPEASLDVIATLHRLGEPQASDHPTRILALYGSAAQRAELQDSSFLLPDLAPYLAYLSGTPEPRGDGLAALRHITGSTDVSPDDPETLGMAGVLALGYGFGDMAAHNRWRPQVENWLMTAASARPIADMCRTSCPDEAGHCAFAVMALSGGYFETIRLDSPSETYIPQADFLSSPRARLMALRRAALTRAETNQGWVATPMQIAEISACAAQLISEARGEYPQ